MRLVGNQKTEAIAMHARAARRRIRRCAHRGISGRSAVPPAALFRQPVERLFEFVAILALQAQLPHQLLVSGAGMRQPANVLEQTRFAEMLRHSVTSRHYRISRRPL